MTFIMTSEAAGNLRCLLPLWRALAGRTAPAGVSLAPLVGATEGEQLPSGSRGREQLLWGNRGREQPLWGGRGREQPLWGSRGRECIKGNSCPVSCHKEKAQRSWVTSCRRQYSSPVIWGRLSEPTRLKLTVKLTPNGLLSANNNLLPRGLLHTQLSLGESKESTIVAGVPSNTAA